MVFEPFVLRIGGPLCINCCWFHFILYTAGATLYLMLWEPLCMYFANSQKGRRDEWAGRRLYFKCSLSHFVLGIGGPLCIKCCWGHFIIHASTLYLILLEPLCMYFANSQKGRRIEWAGWCGLSAWEKSERNVRKPNSGKIQKRRETNIFATSDRSVRKVNEELLEGWKQRDKYFCQKLRTECFGEIFFFFAILTSRTFIFKSIFQWWYRRLPSNEIVSYKSGKITQGGSLVTCRQFPRQICQIVWFRSNDFPSTSFHLKMGIFATGDTISSRDHSHDHWSFSIFAPF